MLQNCFLCHNALLILFSLAWPDTTQVHNFEVLHSKAWLKSLTKDKHSNSIVLSIGISVITIDIESLQNRLLNVYLPGTSASLPRVSFFFSILFLLLRPLTVLMKQTR
jgi:hypothetical protein